MVDNWTKEKWSFLKKYLNAYSIIISNSFPNFYYIDTFSNIGNYNGTYGSPLIALDLKFPFTHYIFVEKDTTKFNILTQNIQPFLSKEALILRKNTQKKVKINIDLKNMDAKDFITNYIKLIPNCPSFIFLDPYGQELEMKSVIECSKKKKAELFINFSVMGVLRNVPIPRCHELLTKYYGDVDWEKIVKVKTNKNDFCAELYINKLKPYFKYVTAHIMRNNNNAPLYYLVHATQNDTGFKIMKDVMNEKDKQSKLNFEIIQNL